jgi:Tfp pilus assembly protein PilV
MGHRELMRHHEQGDTLIEVLIALIVIGICVVALLGAITTTLSSSGEHRSLAADDSLEMSLADQVKNAIQLQTDAHWPHGSGANPDCPSSGLTSWYQSLSNVPLPAPTFTTASTSYPVILTDAPYSGYTISLTNSSNPPQYWNGSSNSWTTMCPPAATGIQKVTVTVTAPNNGPSDTLDVVVRKLSDGPA